MTAFRTILTNSRPKPATVNRLIQALLHHPQFEWAALSSSRDELVAAIHSLFLLHPQNTCQPSQVSPLINIYRGSLEDADLRILDIFRLFEVERRISVATLLSSWSPTASTASPDLLTSISQLDPDRMFGVCLSFPQWRSTGALSSKLSTVERSAGYDPLFIILLLAQLLAREGSNDQLTGISWVQICRTNILAVLICSLSARDDQLRNLGWTVFGGMYDKLEHAPDFFEKKQLVYLLEKVARLYVKTSSQDSTSAAPYHRLPSYTTLFFAHAFRSLFAPSSSLYPLISRFVLQRPEFDPNDPPMLYSMLYSTLSSDLGRKEGRWKRERNWMLRFLSDGMVSSGDWKVLQRHIV
ncbi:hypothetical protein PIIN_01598 [Serendipita indica DSM 11827]|uniref:URB1 C-terminal domain-containing protein n=1 Tax=Serendipita indica (strain DSM 11827) TaxID=1109443 RepID=G4T8W3_SERID|nr:hypothetical protein PIIN_01598 [Serendipita indica DSM 11827]